MISGKGGICDILCLDSKFKINERYIIRNYS